MKNWNNQPFPTMTFQEALKQLQPNQVLMRKSEVKHGYWWKLRLLSGGEIAKTWDIHSYLETWWPKKQELLADDWMVIDMEGFNV